MKAINLIPPDAALRAAARRKRFGFILLGLVYVALLAVGYMYFKGQLTEVEDQLAGQQADNNLIRAEISALAPAAELDAQYTAGSNQIQAIRAEISALAPAAELDAQYTAGSNQIQAILASDIAFGRLLNDLGRVIPDRVWLDSLTATAQSDPANPSALGSVTMNGIAFDYPDAASWLRTLDSDRWPAVGVGWVLSTVQGDVEEVPVVAFASVGVLTAASLDDRAARRIPAVPE